MSTIWKYFKDEKLKRFFSSKKRIIKLIAICLVPFLYGFICIWAFWDPVSNIGDVPMAIVDTSTRTDMAIGVSDDPTNKKILIGEPYKKLDGTIDKDGKGLPTGIFNPNDGTKIGFSECLLYERDFSFIESFIRTWDKNKNPDSLIQKNPDGTYSVALSESQKLNNLSYFNDRTPIKATSIATYDKNKVDSRNGHVGAWSVHNEDYWLQTQIPVNFNDVMLKTISYIFVNGFKETTGPDVSGSPMWMEELSKLKDSPLNVWATFKKNFLFGQFMNVFNEFKSSLVIDFIPKLVYQTLINTVIQIADSSSETFYNKLAFTPKEDVSITIPSLSFHKGSKKEFKSKGEINLKAGTSYIFRNDEIKNAILNNVGNQITTNEIKNLRETKTYEGNTTLLNATKNDWEINNDNLSFIGLIASVFKPFNVELNDSVPTNLNTLEASTFSSPIKKYLTKYASNKMFLSALLEKDASILPKKPIVPLVDGLLKPIINNSNISPAYSKEQLVVTGEEWDSYTKNAGIYISEVIDKILNSKTNLATGPPTLVSLEGVVTSGVLGEEFSPYGIGLGQFFLCIGIWVGCLMQTFVLDRRRVGRSKKPKLKFGKRKNSKKWMCRFAESAKWYYSKTFLMLSLTFIQVTILCLTVYALGWNAIGSAFWLIYLQLLFSSFVFTLFIQSIWFLFRDEVIGKFIVILFLIINLSSGWGTFPPAMQFDTFQVLSYIAPFTYTIKNIGAIVYGVGVEGANLQDTLFILQNVGITLIYVVISIVLGLIGSFKLTKMQFYGCANGKKIAKLIINKKLVDTNNIASLNAIYDLFNRDGSQQTTSLDNNIKMNSWEDLLITKKSIFSKNKYYTIDWNKIEYGYIPELCDKVNEEYPYEKQFKWFVKKYPDHKNELNDAQL